MGRHTQTRTRLPCANYTSPGEDLGRIDPAVVTGQPFTVEKAINFWRDCERFIISVLPAVAAVSRSLISHGLLSGDEAASLASAAMQRQPPRVDTALDSTGLIQTCYAATAAATREAAARTW